jgi:hypothetical protein
LVHPWAYTVARAPPYFKQAAAMDELEVDDAARMDEFDEEELLD